VGIVLIDRREYSGQIRKGFMLERTTIQEIARRAGVSAGTVSRILNGKNKENRPTILKRSAKIRKIASELGYRPNLAARSMLSGKFELVAFVTCGSVGFDWYPKSVIHGLHDSLAEYNSRLVITELTHQNMEEQADSPQFLRQSMVDGVIAMPEPVLADGVMRLFQNHRTPCVTVNHQLAERSVVPDDLGGAKMLTEYVVKRGGRKIGFFRRPTRGSGHYSNHERLEGVTQVMGSHGLGVPATMLYDLAQENRLVGPAEAIAYLKAHPKLDSVICYEVAEAISILIAAAALGRKVPGDLLVTAFHDREIHSEFGMVIPTAIIPFRSVAIEAVRMLMRITSNQELHPPMKRVAYREIIDSPDVIPVS
jgi:LacI family transcriptional regulator